MLQNLLELVKENAQEAIIKNDALPNQYNDEAVKEASTTIQNVLGGAVQNGNLQDVLGLFTDKKNIANNPLVGNIVNQLSGSLGSKFGVDPSNAANIATTLLPQVLNMLQSKTNDPNDPSFDINDLMGQLSGNNGAGSVDFGSIISQMQSGKGVDLAGVAGQLLGGKKGGLGGIIGGFFGK
jgi:hypothetical protein